jgi:hypothetical protein
MPLLILSSHSTATFAISACALLLMQAEPVRKPTPVRPITAVKGASALDDKFYTYFDETPIESPVRQEIAPLATPPSPPPHASASGSPWVQRWGVNSSLNGRLPLGLSIPKNLRLEFRSDLPASNEPQTLLTGQDRLVAVGVSGWTLLEASGKVIVSGQSAGYAPTLDDQAGRLITGNGEGCLIFRRLSNGGEELTVEPMERLHHQRSVVTAHGDHAVIVSRKLDTDLHAAPLERIMVETIDMNYRGQGPVPTSAVMRKEALAFPAMFGARIVLAMADRIFFFEPDLKIQKLWVGNFRSLGMSLDESGNVYLLVGKGAAMNLWRLTPEARRAWDVPLPQAIIRPIQPPIVGYDHTVYLVSKDQILAIAQDGRVLWQKPGAGTIKGAFVTANDLLVTTEGSQIAAWNVAGQRKLLFDASEPLTTPPVMTEGHLYAASSRHLFSLSLK